MNIPVSNVTAASRTTAAINANRSLAGTPFAEAGKDIAIKKAAEVLDAPATDAVFSEDADVLEAVRSQNTPLPSAALTGAGKHLHGSEMKLLPNSQSIAKAVAAVMTGDIETKDLVQKHPMTTDNKIELLVGGAEAFPAIFKAIDAAKDSVNVGYYIFSDDPTGNAFADKLIAAAGRGVDVNITLDGIGSTQFLPAARAILEKLDDGGVNVWRNHVVDFARSGPVFNHPDHRKLVIVDGATAFTGGMNVADHYVSEYHDVMIKVQGPVAQQMQSEWVLNWANLGAPTLKPAGATPEQVQERMFPEPEVFKKKDGGGMNARVLQAIPGFNKEIFEDTLALIDGAKSSLFIENPYCTNPEIQDALIAAGKRGVDIHVVLPGESDHAFSHLAARAKYPEMIEAGVNIHEYPGFNHGKFMVVDEEKVSIGSSNLDDVALRHIYELNIRCDDTGFAKTIKERLFDVDIPKCKTMKAADISDMQRVTGTFWALFSSVI